jgi:hypothetical protein
MRHAVLLSGRMFWFKNANAVEPIGGLSLDYCTCDVQDDREALFVDGKVRRRDTRVEWQYSTQYTQYTVHSTQCAVHSTQYTVHSTRYTVHSTRYTVHSTQLLSTHYTVPKYSVYNTQYTVHSTQCAVHSAPYELEEMGPFHEMRVSTSFLLATLTGDLAGGVCIYCKAFVAAADGVRGTGKRFYCVIMCVYFCKACVRVCLSVSLSICLSVCLSVCLSLSFYVLLKRLPVLG